MQLYKSNNLKRQSLEQVKLKPVKEKKFQSERDLQRLVENNIQELFDLEFAASELTVGNYRLDTLAYDTESQSFAVIEYKNVTNSGLVDQGYAYLAAVLEHKADCILAYNEKSNHKILKRGDVNWEALKVIFVSPSFNQYQVDGVNFKDVPFELWTIKYFGGDLVALTQHRSSSKQRIVPYSPAMKKVDKEVKRWDVDDVVAKMTSECKRVWTELYKILSAAYPEAEYGAAPNYISLRKNKIVCYLNLRKEGLSVTIMRGRGLKGSSVKRSKDYFTLDDPKGMAQAKESGDKAGRIEYYYRWNITTTKDLSYTEYLIRQKYESM